MVKVSQELNRVSIDRVQLVQTITICSKAVFFLLPFSLLQISSWAVLIACHRARKELRKNSPIAKTVRPFLTF